MEAKLEELLVRLAKENEAIEAHHRAFPRRYMEDHAVQADWLKLMSYRETTIEEISEYATTWARLNGRLTEE